MWHKLCFDSWIRTKILADSCTNLLGTIVYEATKILLDLGVNPKKIILSYLNKNPEKYYYEKIMKTRFYIAFDRPDRGKYFSDSILPENIKWFCCQGYQKQIMLAMDASRFYCQAAYSATKGHKSYGIAYLTYVFCFVDEKLSKLLLDKRY